MAEVGPINWRSYRDSPLLGDLTLPPHHITTVPCHLLIHDPRGTHDVVHPSPEYTRLIYGFTMYYSHVLSYMYGIRYIYFTLLERGRANMLRRWSPKLHCELCFTDWRFC